MSCQAQGGDVGDTGTTRGCGHDGAGRGDHGALALVRRGDGDIAVVVMSYDCGHRAGQGPGFPSLGKWRYISL